MAATRTTRKATATKTATAAAPKTTTRRAPATKPATNGTASAASKATEATPAELYGHNEKDERAAKAKATNAAAVASGETRQCEGGCDETKPITQFPTTTRKKDGSMGRASICRKCRDAKRAAKKAAK